MGMCEKGRMKTGRMDGPSTAKPSAAAGLLSGATNKFRQWSVPSGEKRADHHPARRIKKQCIGQGSCVSHGNNRGP
eukprot:scaffold584_cov338-Pavlova_lutheri.AAC.21